MVWSMFKKLGEAVQSLQDSPVLDPDTSLFKDELAEKTSWQPIAGGGANFKTHVLMKKGHHIISFVPSAGSKAFFGIFALVTLALLLFGLYNLTTTADPKGTYMMLGGGVFFALISGVIGYQTLQPAVFDQRTGKYRKGYSEKKPEEQATFSEIHALQIIAEWTSSSNGGGYYSYELNLVLVDGERLNIVDHGDIDGMRKDAHKLSQFLSCPVWDGTIASKSKSDTSSMYRNSR